jgi:sporulation protein YlmC with PRC-barrel domain
MILTDFLGSEVFDARGTRVGCVLDVRLEIAGAPSELLAATIVTGILVSPRSRASTWGYERRGAQGPFLIARLQAWLHRGLFLVPWGDVARVDEDVVRLREGYARFDPRLPEGRRSR